MNGRLACLVLAGGAIAASGLAVASTASAAFPGSNGRIAFVNLSGPGSSQDIYAFSPTGTDRARLTDTPDDDAFPSYSADGERIVFSRSVAGDAGFGQIWVMNADGSGQTQLTNGPPAAESPSYSPDGARIVYTLDNQIWIMNADGSGQTQLTFPGANNDHAHGAEFSPDGQTIAFSHFDGNLGRHDISLMSPNGGARSSLTTPPPSFDDFNPDYSPDGRRVVFDRFDQEQDDLRLINADGSGERPLTSGAGDLDLLPTFSPDGTKVAFERDNANFTVANIVLVDPNGLNLNPTPLTANAAPVQDFEPAWQPLNPPSCALGKANSRSLKRVRVTVTCANENATVTAKGSGKAPKPPRMRAAKAKKFKLRPVTAEAAAGIPTTIKLKVSKKGQRALKQATRAGRKGKATLTATFTDDLGEASTNSLNVKFKPRRK